MCDDTKDKFECVSFLDFRIKIYIKDRLKTKLNDKRRSSVVIL